MLEDVEAVTRVVRDGFSGYMGHYHADPRLDPLAADAAYVEWAETSAANSSSLAPVLVAESCGRILGFLTLRTNSTNEMEIVLNAVEPAFQGRGIYRTLLTEALTLAKARGCSQVIISTQINNYAVQRVWAWLGLYHTRSLYTFHKWF